MKEVLKDLRIAIEAIERAQNRMAELSEAQPVGATGVAHIRGMIRPVAIGARLLLEEAEAVRTRER